MTYRRILGRAIYAGDDFDPDADHDNIRVYQTSDGSYWIGHDTLDVHYYCDDCLPCTPTVPSRVEPAGLGWMPDGLGRTAFTSTANTVDWEPVDGDWPDYDVYCHDCAEIHGRLTLVHRGRWDEETQSYREEA